MALFIVVLLNINSYAAVGANDGSAFVTKAEFDALVNTFNEQMDTYQSGLNAKIDGAIANYLAGLSSVTVVTLDNYAQTYMNALNINYFEPIRQVDVTTDFAYSYKHLVMGAWFFYAPGVDQQQNRTNASAYKHTSGWVFRTRTTGKLEENAANRLRRPFIVLDTNNNASKLVRNIQTNMNTCHLYSARPAQGCDITTFTIQEVSGNYGLNKTTSCYNADVRKSRDYNGSWSSNAGGYADSVNLGAYSYNGTEDNYLMSQICSTTANSIATITDSNYSNRTITTVRHDTDTWYYSVEDAYTAPSNSLPAGMQKPYYGKPVFTAKELSSINSAGYAASGLTAPLYAGVPLCKAKEDGKIKLTITLIYSNLGEINITNKDKGFSNSVTPEPDIEFGVDGGAYSNRWNTNNGLSGDHEIEFKALKNKVYWIKFIPAENGPKYKISGDITEIIE